MAVMKKYILSALTVLLLLICTLSPIALTQGQSKSHAFPLPTFQASAETRQADDLQIGGYGCIRLSGVFFYATKDDGQGLFTLPQNYYVKLIEVEESYCKVEYLYDDAFVQKIVGYVKTQDITAVPYVPKRPYAYKLFDVYYELDDNERGDGFLTQLTATCAYYGDYVVGSKTYCYVLQNGRFGYVPKPQSLSIEPNDEYDKFYFPQQNSSPTPDSSQTPTESSANPTQIALLIVLCLLVPIIASLILKPPRRPPYGQD